MIIMIINKVNQTIEPCIRLLPFDGNESSINNNQGVDLKIITIIPILLLIVVTMVL